MTKLIALAAAGTGAVVLVAAAYLVSIYGRPPMPVSFGTVIWAYETGFTVTRVARSAASPGTTSYDVTVRVFCPYGERYRWSPRSAHVIDNAGRSYYAAAATPAHKILGASDTEHMTFVLSNDIEQPALVFDDALGFAAIFDELRVGRIYGAHRFNLRDD
jgi:hypothetical protein